MSKRDLLCEMLSSGWQRMPALMEALGWQAHTVRGAISTLGKTHKIERQRIEGVTSYRIVKSEDPTSAEIPKFLRRDGASA